MSECESQKSSPVSTSVSLSLGEHFSYSGLSFQADYFSKSPFRLMRHFLPLEVHVTHFADSRDSMVEDEE